MYERLNTAIQRVRFRVEEPLTLPEYKGSTFRGALGHALRSVACALRRENCGTCMLRERCAYSLCFETPVPRDADIMRKYPNAPHPFVLEPPLEDRREYEPGERLDLGLLLVGQAQEHLAHFIYAFDEMAKNGLGRDRRKLALLGVDTAGGPSHRTLYDGAEERLLGTPKAVGPEEVAGRVEALQGQPLKIHFESPVRIVFEGRMSKSAELPALVPNMLRRLSLLHYFFCEGGFEEDVQPLLDAAKSVVTRNADIAWKDWTRYSARQRRTMELGGFVGWAEYEPVPGELLEPLCWGELLHIGKASAFGLGKYRIEPLGS